MIRINKQLKSGHIVTRPCVHAGGHTGYIASKQCKKHHVQKVHFSSTKVDSLRHVWREPWRSKWHQEVLLWLVVSTHLKNISQIGNLPQFSGWKFQKYLSCHHLVLDVYKILRWMMLKNFVFQIIGILEWMGGFVASTHYGSMGRTVYLPTWIVDSCGINVGKYTVTVPWTGSVMGYIMDTYVDPVYRDPSIYKLGMDFLVWISLYWQKITQNPPIYTNSLPNLHSLKLT